MCVYMKPLFETRIASKHSPKHPRRIPLAPPLSSFALHIMIVIYAVLRSKHKRSARGRRVQYEASNIYESQFIQLFIPLKNWLFCHMLIYQNKSPVISIFMHYLLYSLQKVKEFERRGGGHPRRRILQWLYSTRVNTRQNLIKVTRVCLYV